MNSILFENWLPEIKKLGNLLEIRNFPLKPDKKCQDKEGKTILKSFNFLLCANATFL